MLKKSSFTHPVWGKIIVTINSRARNIIMRARHDAILVTVPPSATMANIEQALEQSGERLRQHKQKAESNIISAGYRNENGAVHIYVEEHDANKFQAKWSENNITLLCPAGTDYKNSDTQQFLQKAITNIATKIAKRRLPERLKRLAEIYKFKYSGCSVREAHGSWGCCNTRKEIRLSTYLVLLPDELADYVMLHELCHTVEMNHSDKFWALLDRCTAPQKAQELRKRIKEYRCGL